MARSEVNYIYDAANAFRAPGLPALTESTIDPDAVSLDTLTNVRPSSQRGKLATEEYRIVIVVEDAATSVAEDEAYQFLVLVGTTSQSALVMRQNTNGPGQYVVILDAATVQKMAGNTDFILLHMEATGTAPSITYSAWLA